MQLLKKCFWGLAIIFGLSACDPTYVKIAWDAPESYVNGKIIPSNYELRYNVYIADDEYNDRQCLTNMEPIKEKSFKINNAKVNGPYVVGVQAVLFENDVRVKEDPSEIAWSNVYKFTNEKNFSIDIDR